jgi:hypothetical protein
LISNIASRNECVKCVRNARDAKTTIRLSEAAAHFGVDRKTLLRWWKRGFLQVEMQVLPGGQRRFDRAAFLAAAARVPKTMRPPVQPGEALRTEALRIAERWERRSATVHERRRIRSIHQNQKGAGFAEPTPRVKGVEIGIIGPGAPEVKEVSR